ncbi:DUF6452 family protein [Bizionia paragorgiae]|uniref:Uncharacterized protein n=1 Tax=Bizionia paragorgiae TaxID=283786 RepID=A0A1H3X5I2_BIZPA|nr:DUF6452 family protein [Bizionia paragorgiae]MDX1271763.1 DUF6452 family protein [Bizionia paragorgiae]SDZ94191.1 hypothetical protein SAMN04487990_104139 [Bizionia paragorgiae]
MRKITALLLLVLTLTLSCERDDICSGETPTTPRLIISFLDLTTINLENPKNVNFFRVETVDDLRVLDVYNGTAAADSVILPLKTTDSITQYRMYKDYAISNNGTPNDPSDDFITGNPDVITIEYATEDVYVSKACGYKSIFKNITITVEDDGDNWIEVIQSVNDNQTIENEDTPHFNIFH